MTDDPRLAELVKELYVAKQNEEVAKKARSAVEERIAALVPTAENGSRTVDSGVMKVTVKRANSYKIDDEAEFAAFAKGGARELKVYGSDRTVTYDPQKRIGVMISKIGASKAISVGAYDFALAQLDA